MTHQDLWARLIGFDGAYHRFTGKVTIEKFHLVRYPCPGHLFRSVDHALG
jgi:hypothetical protein